ncbi:MAG: hypothetical protein [Caudoviricetes sp.]|nr:MAG: hypothetical protein [Caudoviricetes sp.]
MSSNNGAVPGPGRLLGGVQLGAQIFGAGFGVELDAFLVQRVDNGLTIFVDFLAGGVVVELLQGGDRVTLLVANVQAIQLALQLGFGHTTAIAASILEVFLGVAGVEERCGLLACFLSADHELAIGGLGEAPAGLVLWASVVVHRKSPDDVARS